MPDVNYKMARRRDLYESIGKRIRDTRKEHGMAGAELAKALGISENTLNAVERGNNCPVYLLHDVAEIFDVTLDDLCPIQTKASAE